MNRAIDSGLHAAKADAAAAFLKRTANGVSTPDRAAAFLADAAACLDAATAALRGFPGPELRGPAGQLVPVNFEEFNATLAAVKAQATAALEYASAVAADYGRVSKPTPATLAASAAFEKARSLCERNLDGYKFAEPLRRLTAEELAGPMFTIEECLADARAALAAEK